MILYDMLRRSTGTVAVNMKPVAGPWGGSSVFVSQFHAVMERYGYTVKYDLRGKVDVIVIIDPRDDLQSKSFGMPEIRAYRRQNPQVRVIHRINECDKRKGTNFMDDCLKDANTIADHTVFISSWLRDYFMSKWFDAGKSNSVIYNGADPAVFHPVGGVSFDGNGPIRLVTHHWADNRMKGFNVYEEVDRMIAEGRVKDAELWVIGRWPGDIKWRAAKTFFPSDGHKLASQLRQCHAYITASLWEPCGMHHVEGAQCGLPLLYHEDGGGIVEAGLKYGIGFRENVSEAIMKMRSDYAEYRKRVLTHMPSGDLMASEYARVVTMLLANKG